MVDKLAAMAGLWWTAALAVVIREFTERSLSGYPLATCLDGSPAVYYHRRGDPKRVFVFFEGGGFCGSLPDCQARSWTHYGSSARDADKMPAALDRPYLQHVGNPLLASFTHVYVRYCDGGYYSGERAAPVAYNGSILHFHGRWITEAVIADLELSALGAGSDIIFGGCSAGGIRVLAHLDALRGLVSPATGARVVGFADSGFYLDLPVFTPLKRFVVSDSGQNATRFLSRACLDAHATEPERCLVAQVRLWEPNPSADASN